MKSITKGRKTKFVTKLSSTITGRSLLLEVKKLYNELNEIRLDKEELKEYFAYEIMNVVEQNFRIKNRKPKEYEKEQL